MSASVAKEILCDLGRLQDQVSDCVRTLIKAILRQHAPSKHIHDLPSSLLGIAKHVAALNSDRLRRVDVGAALPPWTDHDREAVRLVWSLGMNVASTILEGLPATKDTVYDLFLSYAGEDSYYVDTLLSKLTDNYPDARIFRDKTTMLAGTTSDHRSTMLRTVLTCKMILCVTSHHYVQKQWTIAELMSVWLGSQPTHFLSAFCGHHARDYMAP